FNLYTGTVSEIDKKDLTILGRIIAAAYHQKDLKIPVIYKPTDSLNLSHLTFAFEDNMWYVFPGHSAPVDSNTKSLMKGRALISNSDIVYLTAYIVWNNLFLENWMHMAPNSSGVTIQEVINLGNKIKSMMLTYNTSVVERNNYLKKERISKMIVVVSFENLSEEKDINNFCVIYKNNWGEVFVLRLNSKHKLAAFLKKNINQKSKVETYCYLQKSAKYYDKIIERTKKIISSSLGNGHGSSTNLFILGEHPIVYID
ncbi:MAG: hypothetical protein HQK78_04070, partial [Desulfobacterales bacterium]|nr:hypothetical protein [Desulfobacterales bacterium]